MRGAPSHGGATAPRLVPSDPARGDARRSQEAGPPVTLPRLLWIPHTPWAHCQAQRPAFLIDRLSRNFEIHVVTWPARPLRSNSWRYHLDHANFWRALTTASETPGNPYIHQVALPPPILQKLWPGYPPDWMLAYAQSRFQPAIKEIAARFRFQAGVVASSHHFTGYPPHLPGIPLIFDYLDASPARIERTYVNRSHRIVAVSNHLSDQVRERYGRPSVVIPNGLDLTRIQSGDAGRARQRWGLEERRIVSLIGLTCSPRLYFLDALALLCSEFPDLIFVAAGHGRLETALRARCARLGIPAVFTGWLSPQDAADLFQASSVGLYPGDDTPYFDGAFPLKVLEYTGAGVPVVANQVAELERVAFPNVMLRPARANSFAGGIREALLHPPTAFPDLTSYDWDRIGAAFGHQVEALMAEAT